MEEVQSTTPNLRYIKADANNASVLAELLNNQYDGIIDFLHYPDIDAFRTRIPMILQNTKHYVFLSSYRVYADSKEIISEESPRLTEQYANDLFLMQNDTYGVRKCLGEDELNQSPYSNYTIVRPVVVYGENRYPITTWAGNVAAYRAKCKQTLLLPLEAKDKGAALIYAGDIAKMFANILFNEKAMGETYTFGSGEYLTWGEVADIYQEVCGCHCEWIPAERFAKMATGNSDPIPEGMHCMLYYDRLFNRRVDVGKIFNDAELEASEIRSFKAGLKICYDRFPDTYTPSDWEKKQCLYMDEYLEDRNR